jgi:hypothetical protein
MHIDAQSTLYGRSILEIRKLLRAGDTGTWGRQLVTRVLGVDGARADELLRALASDSYIEPDSDAGQRWHNTIKGNALAHASTTAPLKRATAERNLEAFLERVKHVNADRIFAYVVETVILFGSLLGDTPTVNDVDLAVQLRPRCNDSKQFRAVCEQRINAALDEGRTFSNISEHVAWPQTEVVRFLKGRSRVLNVHDADLEQQLLAQVPTCVIYTRPGD